MPHSHYHEGCMQTWAVFHGKRHHMGYHFYPSSSHSFTHWPTQSVLPLLTLMWQTADKITSGTLWSWHDPLLPLILKRPIQSFSVAHPHTVPATQASSHTMHKYHTHTGLSHKRALATWLAEHQSDQCTPVTEHSESVFLLVFQSQKMHHSKLSIHQKHRSTRVTAAMSWVMLYSSCLS